MGCLLYKEYFQELRAKLLVTCHSSTFDSSHPRKLNNKTCRKPSSSQDFFAVEILLHWRKLSPSKTLASAAGLPLTSSLYLKPKQNHGFLLLYTVCKEFIKTVVFKPSEVETILSVDRPKRLLVF
ncbi:hypothetical protein QL285_070255 [Trifolium repens]|nr:hypothetical protein QL285_070255 [Trifolium repens]